MTLATLSWPALGCAALLLVAMLASAWQLARRWRATASAAPLPWSLLLAVQPTAALLLWLALFPLPSAPADDTLVLATAGSTPAMLARLPARARVLALPEAPRLPGIARTPDLAGALRAQPATRLRVLGQGLATRDRDAARGLPTRFDPAPLPRGIVGLWRATDASAGLPFELTIELAGLQGGRVELLDPADRVTASAVPDDSGRATLAAVAPVAGVVEYTLQVRDAGKRIVQRESLPVQVHDGARPRLLLLAGGPSPELKYLQRWAEDAGFAAQARVALGGGASLGANPTRLDPATLRAQDTVVLDDRAWRALDSDSRAGLLQAAREGLGVLVRLTGPVDSADQARWRALGFDIAPADLPESVQLTPASAALSRQPVRVTGAALQSNLRDATGEPLAAWRAFGQGRVGLAWFGDSYRLVLAGQRRLHAQAWSKLLGALTRAQATQPPWLEEAHARVGQRAVVCAEGDALKLSGPDGADIPIAPQSHGSIRCAAFWPTAAGWHHARAGTATAQLLVIAGDALPGVRAREARDATLALAVDAVARGDAASVQWAAAGPRWPWALAWLVLAAFGWALERRLLRHAPMPRD